MEPIKSLVNQVKPKQKDKDQNENENIILKLLYLTKIGSLIWFSSRKTSVNR